MRTTSDNGVERSASMGWVRFDRLSWFKDKLERRPLRSSLLFLILFLSVSYFGGGCVGRTGTPEERQAAAKALFDRTTKTFHLPSADATGADQQFLREEALKGYEELARRYADQSEWASQAIRSMGNIYASQTNLTRAVKQFRRVGEKYPGEEWEVMMAWKSAGDLLWDAERHDEAREFYEKIVDRFPDEDYPPMMKLVVKGAARRLEPQQ